MAVTPTPPTTNYGHLSTIKDGATRRVVKLILDRLGDIERRSGGIGTLTKPLTADLNADGNQLKSLKDPTNDRDAVTLQFLKTYVQQALVTLAPVVSGTAPGTGTPAFPSTLPGGGDGGEMAQGFAAALPTGHDAGGELTPTRAGQIVGGTVNEWIALTAAAPTQAVRDANQLELLLRMIWHLRLAGFSAGRQRNPSGATSGDKLTVVVNGVLRAYDVFQGVAFGDALPVHILEVTPAAMLDDPGTAD
jgi:hypothetical protein